MRVAKAYLFLIAVSRRLYMPLLLTFYWWAVFIQNQLNVRTGVKGSLEEKISW